MGFRQKRLSHLRHVPFDDSVPYCVVISFYGRFYFGYFSFLFSFHCLFRRNLLTFIAILADSVIGVANRLRLWGRGFCLFIVILCYLTVAHSVMTALMKYTLKNLVLKIALKVKIHS